MFRRDRVTFGGIVRGEVAALMLRALGSPKGSRAVFTVLDRRHVPVSADVEDVVL